jgi:ABC-type ATPase involved in cell division/GNAT superfamily N-acetyltransferase
VTARATHHPNALDAAALFGIELPLTPLPREVADLEPPAIGEILLLTGPSGAGKTTALCRLASLARRDRTIIDLSRIRPRPVPAVAQFKGLSAEAAMKRLAAAGLADARAFLKTPDQLSAGQRWRLSLALALRRAETSRKPPLLIADEFAALLDEDAARAVARLLRRAVCRTPRLAGVIATNREQLAPHLAPNRHTRFHLAAPPTTHEPTTRRLRPTTLHLRFAPGTTADYEALAPLHYLPSRPATIDHVLTARSAGQLAAVLVVSRPTLNSPHRDLAWPRRYTAPTKPAAAKRLNRELRTISRVIVDPRFQGLGVARRLVARYLASPLTPCTEALAAMGAVCPFFARAGMTAYRLPPSARAARLTDALAAAGLTPRDLAAPDLALRNAERAGRLPFLERELRRYVAASGAPQRRARDSLQALCRHAAPRLCPPVAYAHTAS